MAWHKSASAKNNHFILTLRMNLLVASAVTKRSLHAYFFFVLVSIICFHVVSDSIISTIVFIRHLVSRHLPLLLLLIHNHHLHYLVLIVKWDAGEPLNAD